MAELWMLIGMGAAILLLGFASRLAFDRWRVPDFLVLIAAGMAVGPAGANLVAPDLRASIDGAAPLLLAVAVAFIMFEAGLNLQRMKGSGGGPVLILHTLAAGALTFLLVWWVSRALFGLSSPSAIVLAAAVLGPSAVVVSGFAHRLRIDPRTKRALIVEGVLANVIAFFVITSLPLSGGASGQAPLFAAGATLFLAVTVALAVALLWTFAVRSLHSREGVLIATLALALGIYAVASGVLGGHGAVAVFAFGALLGRMGVFAAPSGAGAVGRNGQGDLERFHGEMAFLVRTFFFFYLGLIFEPATVTGIVLPLAVTLVVLFLVARLPTTWLLGQVWRLPRNEVLLLSGSVARGLSDTVVVLFAIQAGYIPTSEAGLLAAAMVVLLVLSVAVTAAVVSLTERLGDAHKIASPETPADAAQAR